LGLYTDGTYAAAVFDCSYSYYLSWSRFGTTCYAAPGSYSFSWAGNVLPGTYRIAADFASQACTGCCSSTGPNVDPTDPRGNVTITVPCQTIYSVTGITITL